MGIPEPVAEAAAASPVAAAVEATPEPGVFAHS